MGSENHELVIAWEHVGKNGRRSLSPWYYSLEKLSRSRFDTVLHRVKVVGLDAAEAIELLTPVSKRQKTKKNRAGYTLLRELRVHANPQLRPLLCRGPVDRGSELTFLAPAIEKGDRLKPPNAVDQAIERYQEVVDDPTRNRRLFPDKGDVPG